MSDSVVVLYGKQIRRYVSNTCVFSCINAFYNSFTLRRHLKTTWLPLSPGLQFLREKKQWSSQQATKIKGCLEIAALPWETSVEKYHRSAVDVSINGYHY